MRNICNFKLIFSMLFCAPLLLAILLHFRTISCHNESHGSYPYEISAQLGSVDNDLFVFIQITDLHISLFRSSDRYEQLKDFCRTSLRCIQPSVVLVSGDITDAIAGDLIVAKQFEEEWKLYHKFYNSCMAESGIFNWLDLRGNHDNFNVDGYKSSMNFYSNYGAQRDKPGSYISVIHGPNNKSYAFVAVDATLDPGPKRILNFFGSLDEKKIEKLEQFQKEIENTNVSASFWFGHYPSSIIESSNRLRALTSKGMAYFCGHLHTWGGLVPKMYSLHSSGMLELELADWKKTRTYRIAVMDQGLFTFADVKHGVWPAVIILNPKPLITVQRSKEPFHLVVNSSHIRLLVYSPFEIELCQVRIDDGAWKSCRLTGKKSPLFTAPWSPSIYANGVHTLEVKAKDKSGSESLTTIEFALDGTSVCFPALASLALSKDLITIGYFMFGALVFALTVPLLGLRVEHHLILRRKASRRKARGLFTRGFRIVANIDILFYSLTIYTLYLAFGPWFYGDLIDGKKGWVFIWGTYLSGTFQPGALTFYYGAFHLLVLNFPLLLILAHVGDTRFKEEFFGNYAQKEPTWWRKHRKAVPFLCFLLLQIIGTIIFGVSYGFMATIVNPFRTWALVLSCFLWYRTRYLTKNHFENISKTLV